MDFEVLQNGLNSDYIDDLLELAFDVFNLKRIHVKSILQKNQKLLGSMNAGANRC